MNNIGKLLDMLRSRGATWVLVSLLVLGLVVWMQRWREGGSPAPDGEPVPNGNPEKISGTDRRGTGGDTDRDWRMKNGLEERRLEEAGVYSPANGPGFALMNEQFRVSPEALAKAGAPPDALPQIQAAVDRAMAAQSSSIASRAEHCPGRNGLARCRIWASKESAAPILEKLRSDFVAIAGGAAGEKLASAFSSSVRGYGDGFGLRDIEIEEIKLPEPGEKQPQAVPWIRLPAADGPPGESGRTYLVRKYNAYTGSLEQSFVFDAGSDEMRQCVGADMELP